MSTDLFDTSNCPLGVRCEVCGAEAGVRGKLSTITVDTAIGVICLTVDETCRGGLETDGASLTLMPSTIERLVKQHQQHLGRRLD